MRSRTDGYYTGSTLHYITIHILLQLKAKAATRMHGLSVYVSLFEIILPICFIVYIL